MHFLQTDAWAKVRISQGHKLIKFDNVNMLVKSALKGFIKVGNIQQANINELDFNELIDTARAQKIAYIHVDPDNLYGQINQGKLKPYSQQIVPAEEIMLRNTIIIDLTKSEEELLNEIEKNTKYNIRYSAKKGVKVRISDNDEDLEVFLKLFFHTKSHKYFFARDEKYYRQIWKVLKAEGRVKIAVAEFEGEPLVARFLFTTDEGVYTPYTGHIPKHTNLKPTYLILWEVMMWAKNNGFKYINLWGIKPELKQGDQEFGYTKFKMNFSMGNSTTYENSFDIIIDPVKYKLVKVLDGVRWMMLQIKKKFV